MKKKNPHASSTLALVFGSLGVVFGDIGTSPLYALRECFGEYGLMATSENVLGILSLMFWTLIVVICFKYMIFIMRADNKGEGGILSLMALALSAQDSSAKSKLRWTMSILGIFGAAVLYGDGIITPAMSVLSAVEGLSIAAPQLSSYIVPISALVIVGLFYFQKFGTRKIGTVFGPILFIWFLVIGTLGAISMVENLHIFQALLPSYGIRFLFHNETHGFFVLGSVVLVVTGGEALYADMGHFGKNPIRLAWFIVALPALILNYFGQGALILNHPEAAANPFYMLAPEWAQIPLVILSTTAAIIASQALISGVFSITRQAIQLGWCPRMTIVHTSSREIGQIYIPMINTAMLVGVLILIFTFGSSANLASAYGIAVTATMLITSFIAYEVARKKWNWGFAKAFALFGFFSVVDMGFLGANLRKLSHGGWVPIAIGIAIFILMTTWHQGREVLFRRLKEHSISMKDFLAKLLKNPPHRVAGTAIYLTADSTRVPASLLHNFKHNKILHERLVFLTMQTLETPSLSDEERVTILEIMPNIFRVIANYGFMETPKMKHILEACQQRDIHFSDADTTFVMGRVTVIASKNSGQVDDSGMPLWKEKLFALMSKSAERPAAFFRIPPDQVIEVGIQIEI